VYYGIIDLYLSHILYLSKYDVRKQLGIRKGSDHHGKGTNICRNIDSSE
jgi:hypothetical protein